MTVQVVFPFFFFFSNVKVKKLTVSYSASALMDIYLDIFDCTLTNTGTRRGHVCNNPEFCCALSGGRYSCAKKKKKMNTTLL